MTARMQSRPWRDNERRSLAETGRWIKNMDTDWIRVEVNARDNERNHETGVFLDEIGGF